MSQKPAVGILFGSQYITVASHNGKSVDIITTIDGSRATPVFITKTDDEWMVGESSKEQHIYNMSSTTTSLANVLSVEEYAQELFHYLFELIQSHTGMSVEKQRACVVVDTPELRDIIMNYLSKRFASVTWTTTPLAAALAYNYDLPRKEDTHVAAFDIGGESASLTILKSDTKGYVHNVQSFSSKHASITGDAIDGLVMEYLFKMFAKKAKCIGSIDELSKKSKLKLKYKAEEAKCVLSSTNKVQVDIPAVHEGIDLSIGLTRSRYDILIKPVVAAAEAFIAESLAKVNVPVQSVMLMGGTLLIPKLAKAVESAFKRALTDTITIESSKSLREVAAEGAALQGSYLAGVIGNVPAPCWAMLPHAVDIKVDDQDLSTLFEKDTSLPVTSDTVFDVQSSVSLYSKIDDQSSLISSTPLSGKFRLSMLASGECECVPV